MDGSENGKRSAAARRQNMTPDERAKQNRDRNREHARNTRLRKKAYVEELKKTLQELVAQRETAELEKRQAAQRELEQREVRFRVIEEFLKLRGRNETNPCRWAAILEEGFTLSLPSPESYHRSNTGAKSATDGTLRGVAEVMSESSSFSSFLQVAASPAKGAVSFQYHCDRSNFFMDGCNAFLEWTGSLVNAVSLDREFIHFHLSWGWIILILTRCLFLVTLQGSSAELVLRGVVRGKFCPASNKLVSANVSYDASRITAFAAGIGNNKNKDAMVVPMTAAADIAAAEAADAILDSLEMPRLATVLVPAAVNVVHCSGSSTEDSSSDKGELDSDDSVSGDNMKSSSVVEDGTVNNTTSTVSCS
jgi:hypothetical protein